MPKFKELFEINENINEIKNVWGIYEEFQAGISQFQKEDWVSFRTKTFKFEEFLQVWQDRLKKELQKDAKPSTMQLKIQQDIDTLKVNIFIQLNYHNIKFV